MYVYGKAGASLLVVSTANFVIVRPIVDNATIDNARVAPRCKKSRTFSAHFLAVCSTNTCSRSTTERLDSAAEQLSATATLPRDYFMVNHTQIQYMQRALLPSTVLWTLTQLLSLIVQSSYCFSARGTTLP